MRINVHIPTVLAALMAATDRPLATRAAAAEVGGGGDPGALLGTFVQESYVPEPAPKPPADDEIIALPPQDELLLPPIDNSPVVKPKPEPVEALNVAGASADLVHFDVRTADALVDELMSADADVEFRNVRGSAHLAACAALFTNGHAAGTLMRKDPTTGALERDADGRYVPSDTFILPERGVILSSGAPVHFNGNDKVGADTPRPPRTQP